MKRRVRIGVSVAATLVMGLTVFGHVMARGVVVTNQLSLGVATFAGREYSDDNKNGTSVCTNFVPLANGGENLGDLDNGAGSYLAPVNLPNGATVTTFRLFVNDADADTDAYAFLYRKKAVGNMSPPGAGLLKMADVHSNGAVTNQLRKFEDTSINGPTIDNSKNYYFVEVVDCGVPEPYSVQIIYTTA